MFRKLSIITKIFAQASFSKNVKATDFITSDTHKICMAHSSGTILANMMNLDVFFLTYSIQFIKLQGRIETFII